MALEKRRPVRWASLPPRLRLGITVDGMRTELSQLPTDAVQQANDAIPRDKTTGEPKYPGNDAINGYVLQHFVIRKAMKDGLSVCERLQKVRSPEVGLANIFVSWPLSTPMMTLFDALDQFLRQNSLHADETFFWVCYYSIRQTPAKVCKADVKALDRCIEAIGHTVLLLEPWHAPEPLKRAYCITEVYHTQVSGAAFDVVMSTAQQMAFEQALVEDFDSIAAAVSRVDVRKVGRCGAIFASSCAQSVAALSLWQAQCLWPEDRDRILGELERDVGFVQCNELVIGLLREALVAQAKAALARLPAQERGASVLISNLAGLLVLQGRLEEAKPLREEYMQACRKILGNHHTNTLISINNLARLLQDMGKLEEAKPLCEEALEASKEVLGDRHPQTLQSINNMAGLLKAMGKLEDAKKLLHEALQARREVLGDRHPHTLMSINNMASLLQNMGELKEARPLSEEALQGYRETLGDRHPNTFASINIMARLLQDMDELEEAKPLYEEAVVTATEMLGKDHAHTQIYRYHLEACACAIQKRAEFRTGPGPGACKRRRSSGRSSGRARYIVGVAAAALSRSVSSLSLSGLSSSSGSFGRPRGKRAANGVRI